MHSATTPTTTLAVIIKVRRFIDTAFRQQSFLGFLRHRIPEDVGFPAPSPAPHKRMGGALESRFPV
jgi:hypothetical protein